MREPGLQDKNESLESSAGNGAGHDVESLHVFRAPRHPAGGPAAGERQMIKRRTAGALTRIAALGAVLLAQLAPAAEPARKLKIGISVPSATHGWTGGVVWSANRAKQLLEKENADVEVIVTTGATTAEQADRIENLIARQVDALVMLCQEPGPLTPVCERAKAQGIYLVVVSNPLLKPVQDHFVNGDNRSLGEAAAEAIGTLVQGKGDILVMEGIPCPINTDRVEGFKTVLAAKYPAIRILDSQPAWWNTEKGMNLMELYLQKYPQVDAVWAGDDDVLIGALKAYRNSGRKDVKAMVGGGGSKLIVKRVLDNDPVVKATVTYSPRMVEVGARKALEGLRNQRQPVGGIRETLIKSEIVTPANARDHYFPDSVY